MGDIKDKVTVVIIYLIPVAWLVGVLAIIWIAQSLFSCQASTYDAETRHTIHMSVLPLQ